MTSYCATIQVMGLFAENLKKWRKDNNVSGWRIEKLSGLKDFRMRVSAVETGKKPPTDDFIKKLSSINELGLSYPELLSWKLIEEYGEDVFKEALAIVANKRGIK